MKLDPAGYFLIEYVKELGTVTLKHFIKIDGKDELQATITPVTKENLEHILEKLHNPVVRVTQTSHLEYLRNEVNRALFLKDKYEQD